MKTDALYDNRIRSSTGIKQRIMHLKAQREEEELVLKRDVKELQYSFKVSTMIRKTFQELRSDREFKSDALNGTMRLGANFLLDNIMLRSGSGIKKYLLHTGLKKVVSYFISSGKLNIFRRFSS